MCHVSVRAMCVCDVCAMCGVPYTVLPFYDKGSLYSLSLSVHPSPLSTLSLSLNPSSLWSRASASHVLRRQGHRRER